MKKLAFLPLCLSLAVLFSSCKKDVQSKTNPSSIPVAVIASNWVAASSMTWSYPTATQTAFVDAQWSVPELTDDVVTNGAVLVYVKSTTDKTVKTFPAKFDGSNSTNFDLYRSAAGQQTIQLSHTQYSNGMYTTPKAANASFRYILFKNKPASNARIATDALVAGYNLDELKRMDYNTVISLLGITQ